MLFSFWFSSFGGRAHGTPVYVSECVCVCASFVEVILCYFIFLLGGVLRETKRTDLGRTSLGVPSQPPNDRRAWVPPSLLPNHHPSKDGLRKANWHKGVISKTWQTNGTNGCLFQKK